MAGCPIFHINEAERGEEGIRVPRLSRAEHVAQVVLPYVLLLVQSISKHWGLNFVLGLGSRYDGMYG